MLSLAFLLLFATSSWAGFLLTPSRAGELRIAASSDLRENGQRRIVARSYDGQPWEVVRDVDFTPVTITCTSTCEIVTPGSYQITSLQVPPQLLNLTTAKLASRFLLQSTFGGNMATIQSFVSRYGTNYGRWILDQISLAPTLGRVYFRQRAGARTPTAEQLASNPNASPPIIPGTLTQVCDLNTRWNTYAFEQRDVGKLLVISKSSNSFILTIDGYLRGEVQSFLGQPFPGSNITAVTFPATVRICNLREGVDMPVLLSANASTVCLLTWVNPAIKLSTFTFVQTDSTASFVAVTGTVGSFILKSRSVACQNKIDGGGNSFIQQGSVFYRFDPRLRYINNLVTSPTPVAPANGKCPAVTRSYQNAQFCTRQPACTNLLNNAACGSYGEVADVPELGWHYMVYISQTNSFLSSHMEFASNSEPRHVVTNLHLKATDQLRQRIAWSLANIVTIGTTVGYTQYPESWLSFYDIFVRNAFGNYWDILKDVSYHPLMGLYLTYQKNQAFSTAGQFPDENYAREIMQLYSLGLYLLNDDYTLKLDSQNKPINTYTTKNIMDFARVWTGLDRTSYRDNIIDVVFGTSSGNLLDPQVMRSGHDRFPKANLYSGYLGDGYPLCDQLPRAFLLKGARFELTGNASIEGSTIDAEDPTNVGLRGRLTPTTSSALYKALCASKNGVCTFPLSVTLTSNLACTGNQECQAGRVLVVKIIDSTTKVTNYYSFIPPPCVRLTFFDNGKLLIRRTNATQCGDPTTAVGAPVCCPLTNPTRAINNYTATCMFANEATTYQTNVDRCAAFGLGLCNGSLTTGSSWSSTCGSSVYQWTSTGCSINVQVYPRGVIGIVDPSGLQFPILRPSSRNSFRVNWDGDRYPAAVSGACPGQCQVQPTPDGDSCLCSIKVTSGLVFRQFSELTSSTTSPATRIAQLLSIGSLDPRLFATGTYTQCITPVCASLGTVKIWLHSKDAGALSEDTIFELPPFRSTKPRFLRNRLSTVSVGGDYSFRNPPRFSPLLGELLEWSEINWARQATYEVDALLEHLYQHDNLAPFLSHHLIQQLVTSNPSPRYVQSVVQAFRTGTYQGTNFSRTYGDLGATVYAILMDPEARSPVVEADPTFGMFRDPYTKILHVLRALDYKSPIGRELSFENLQGAVGVAPFGSPSVFGFYLPEFQPDGPVAEFGLVAPAAQVATPPNIVNFVNGILSLIDSGMTSCNNGFGARSFPYPGRNCRTPLTNTDGLLTFKSSQATATQVATDLDLLLTAGRLSDRTRGLLLDEFRDIQNRTNSTDQAVAHVTKLILASPDFHSSSINMPTTTPRPVYVPIRSQGRRLKAIVVVFEAGGADSFNMIVPHSNCARDLYAEYEAVRGLASIPKSSLLPISVPLGTQPCDTFGMHPSLPKIRSLYSQREALWMANIGSLIEPLTGEQFSKGAGRAPPAVGAHNTMQINLQSMKPQDASSKGIFGRIRDVLVQGSSAFKTMVYSLSGDAKMAQGSISATMVNPVSVIPIQQQQMLGRGISSFTNFSSKAVFADTYADSLSKSVYETAGLQSLLATVNVSTIFPTTSLGSQLQQTSRLIAALSKAGDVERALFFTSIGGFDSHNTFDLAPIFGPVDDAVGAFASEMKAKGLWDDVVIMSISDFGRTLASNGFGTDHAWGGNHFVAGGNIAGGKILGKYPDVLTDASPHSFGRGRLVPTSPFEAIWKPLAEWFGVPSSQLAQVLPNLANFPASQIFPQSQVFERTTSSAVDSAPLGEAPTPETTTTTEPSSNPSQDSSSGPSVSNPSTVVLTSSTAETFPGWVVALLALGSVALVLIVLVVIMQVTKKPQTERF